MVPSLITKICFGTFTSDHEQLQQQCLWIKHCVYSLSLIWTSFLGLKISQTFRVWRHLICFFTCLNFVTAVRKMIAVNEKVVRLLAKRVTKDLQTPLMIDKPADHPKRVLHSPLSHIVLEAEINPSHSRCVLLYHPSGSFRCVAQRNQNNSKSQQNHLNLSNVRTKWLQQISGMLLTKGKKSFPYRCS